MYFILSKYLLKCVHSKNNFYVTNEVTIIFKLDMVSLHVNTKVNEPSKYYYVA